MINDGLKENIFCAFIYNKIFFHNLSSCVVSTTGLIPNVQKENHTLNKREFCRVELAVKMTALGCL